MLQHPVAAEPLRLLRTWEDFIALDEDDPRELIDGQFVETEMPGKRHEIIVAVLVRLLGNWAAERAAGQVFPSGYKVRVNKTRGIMPDVQFYRRDNPADLREEGCVAGRPDLVVEVISPKRRRFDRVTKLAYYAAIGVPEYWIIDPEERTFERLLLESGRYLLDASLVDDAVFSPPSFEGLAIPLAELWPAEVPSPAREEPIE
jgi:Uma2 family endonuclease